MISDVHVQNSHVIEVFHAAEDLRMIRLKMEVAALVEEFGAAEVSSEAEKQESAAFLAVLRR